MSDDETAPDYRFIRADATDGIGRITFNRPETLNALMPDMLDEVVLALAAFEADDDVRVLLLDAEGEGFSAGGDKAFLDNVGTLQPFEVKRQVYASFGAAARGIKLFTGPTVAAVNGPAYGAGCEFAIACDFRIASSNAEFCESWIQLGLISPLGGMMLLPRIVGLAKASEMLMLGEAVDAAEALRIGLVNKVVAPEDLAAEAWTFAERLARGAPLGLAAMKEGLRRGMESTLAAEWEHNIYVQSMLLASGDFKEGVAALKDRRRPAFKGR